MLASRLAAGHISRSRRQAHPPPTPLPQVCLLILLSLLCPLSLLCLPMRSWYCFTMPAISGSSGSAEVISTRSHSATGRSACTAGWGMCTCAEHGMACLDARWQKGREGMCVPARGAVGLLRCTAHTTAAASQAPPRSSPSRRCQEAHAGADEARAAPQQQAACACACAPTLRGGRQLQAYD